MKLVAYVIDGHHMDLRPAPVDRDWMDATDYRFAYRCLPLNIANAHGWEILCPAGFTATWNGDKATNAIDVRVDDGAPAPAITHFGFGVLTFHVPCIFRTEEGYDLLVQGPMNSPKDAIAPLSGIIETDWAPYTFTMNWIFTQPEIEVRFEKGEPFCHLFPVRRGGLEAVEPEIRALSTDPELKGAYEAWNVSRSAFNDGLKETGSKAQADKWQKLYYQGLDPGGAEAARDHRTRLRLRPFVKR